MHSNATGPTGSRADTTGEVAPSLQRANLELLQRSITRELRLMGTTGVLYVCATGTLYILDPRYWYAVDEDDDDDDDDGVDEDGDDGDECLCAC